MEAFLKPKFSTSADAIHHLFPPKILPKERHTQLSVCNGACCGPGESLRASPRILRLSCNASPAISDLLVPLFFFFISAGTQTFCQGGPQRTGKFFFTSSRTAPPVGQMAG